MTTKNGGALRKDYFGILNVQRDYLAEENVQNHFRNGLRKTLRKFPHRRGEGPGGAKLYVNLPSNV